MKLISEEIRTYIKKEGLSEFLPEQQRQYNFSYIWLFGQMLLAGYIARHQNIFLGFMIPVLVLWMWSIIYFFWRKLREHKKHDKEDFTKPLSKDNLIYSGIILFGLPSLGAICLSIITKSWTTFPIFLLFSTIITLTALFFNQNDYIFIDL